MSNAAVAYRTSPIRPLRRSKADIVSLRELLAGVVEQYQPMTVRQVFYRLVSMGAIEKSEQEYKGTVCRLLADMRREHQIPFRWIADNTRWQRKPRTHSSLEAALRDTAALYRRSVWDRQPAYVETWLEKDALADVLYEETRAWDVPLMVTRGFSSLTFLHSAAEAIAEVGKPAFLYYFGDHDPSGVHIPRKVESGIRELAPAVDLTFRRIAVTPEQIVGLGLPTRPTKASDSRSKGFVGESVEVDAIEPDVLRTMVRESIVRHIDRDEYARMTALEREERATLMDLYMRWPSGEGAA